MRITFLQSVLLLSLIPWGWASDGRAQDLLQRRVSLQASDQQIERVLDQLEKAAEVRFMYSREVVRSQRRVSLAARDETLAQVLDKLLAPLNLAYEVVGQQIVVKRGLAPPISPDPTLSAPTDFSVSGRVTDEVGDGLPGVSILLKGTTRGTTTDVDGKFKLSVPDAGGTLVFSYVGYQSQELALTPGQTLLNVTLESDTKNLQEVVVVGYGTQNRQEVTSAVASVDLKEIKDMPLSNVATALQGKVAGVQIQQTSGRPGSNPAIRVRGFGSISAGNSPLVVLDGNIVDIDVFNILDPSEIEGIDVLKDASATAIYGSRGSNGVIIVSTRRGKSGRAVINASFYTGVQQLERKMSILNSQQFAEFSREASNNAYLDLVPGANTSDPNSARPVGQRFWYPRGELYPWFNFDDPQRVAALPYTDFQDLVFQQAPISSYQVNASGGNDKVRYFLSGGYLNQDGIVKQSNFTRYSLRADVTAELTPKLRVGVTLNPSFRRRFEPTTDGHWASNGVINAAISAVPMAPVYAADGVTYSSQTELAALYNWPGITNPLANITEYDNTNQTLALLSNIFAEYDIIPGLKYRLTGNANINSGRTDQFRTSQQPLNQLLPPTQATANAFTSQTINLLFNQTLAYDKKIGDAHTLQALLGMEATRNDFISSGMAAINFANDVVRTLNAGTVNGGNTFRGQQAVASYFARVAYSYKGRYLFNVSIRRDGSSQFGPNNRWGTFPAVSGGWNLTGEDFMKGLPVVSNLKLRASYGLSGNNAFGNYPYVGAVGIDNYVLGNGLVSGLAPSSLSNLALGWERSRQADLGLDIGVLADRFNLTVDYYERLTTDLLFTVPVPTLTGFGSIVQNIGKVSNKGWEFGINTRNLVGKFKWSSSGNLSLNRNRVLALGPTGDPLRTGTGVGETNITVIGEPLGNFFGFQQIGVYRDQADLDASAKTNNSRPGDAKYADLNGDRVIDANDRTLIGNNQPDFIYGLTNNFSFLGFDLSVAIQGVQGGEILNLSRRFYENLEGNANQLTTVLNRWRSPTDLGDGVTPRANSRTTGLNNQVSTRWVEDASYLRIQNITLGYNLPKIWLDKVKIQSVRVYGSVQNLRTFTSYTSYNPETSNFDGALSAGVDYGAFPLPRTIIFGLNLGF